MCNFAELSWLDEMALPAKKYKLYKSSINKSLHFAQDATRCQTPGTTNVLKIKAMQDTLKRGVA